MTPCSHSSADTVLIAHNPLAGPLSRAAQVRDLTAQLASDGWQVIPVHSLAELASRAAELRGNERLRAVVAAGGDGTLGAVVNGTPEGSPLLVYPLGTENLVAKYFGYRRQPDFLATTLESGVEFWCDAGRAGSRLFVLMVSAGFDAEVVRRVAEGRVGNIRRWTYAKPLLATMRTYRYPELRIEWKGPPAGHEASVGPGGSAKVRWAFAMNLSKYAFGFNFAPAAVGTDGLLDVCTFSGGSVFHAVRYAWGVFSRRHLNYPDARLIRCSEMRIEGPPGVRVPYQLDGDFGGFLPVDVCVLPRSLRFLVHPKAAQRLAPAAPG